jgi:FixJ family two-component response regulator
MTDSKRASILDDHLTNWGRSNRGAFDADDAARVTRAWRTLTPRHREILRMVYLWHANREVACRRLRIPRHPPHLFELELAAARSALARALP